VPHLNKLRESYEEKGLRILALTSETPEKVKPFVEKNRLSYPVGMIDRAQLEAYGGGGIPHAYLVAPNGKVVWHGHPASLTDGEVEKHLRKTTDFGLRKIRSEAKQAATAFKKGRLAETEKLAKQLVEDGATSEQGQTDATYLLRRVSNLVGYWDRTAKATAESGLYGRTFEVLGKIQKHYAGSELATNAAETSKALKADPNVKKELSLTKKLDKLKARFHDAGTDRRGLDSCQKRVQKFIDKNKGTKAAARAEKLLYLVKIAERK